MNEIDEYILEAIHLNVWGGFDSLEDVNQMVSDILVDGANEKMLREAINLEFEKKHKAEKSWPKITDFDHLDLVFSKLKNQGVLCLHNAGITKQDSHDDAYEELNKYPKDQFFGYCYYHRQDLDRAITGNGLMLGYDYVKGDILEKAKVAQTIKKELQNAGFDIDWDGSTETRINIPKIDWKHRYSEYGKISLVSAEVSSLPSKTSVSALNVLIQWNDRMMKEEVISHNLEFTKEYIEFRAINEWFRVDSKLDEKDRFFRFATDLDGSTYYLWFYPELEGEPPVVTINLTDDSADNVTENITDFVCNLIQGESLSGEPIYNNKSNNFHKVEVYKNEMLKRLNCGAKVKVFLGLIKHPKFNEWLDKLDIKYKN